MKTGEDITTTVGAIVFAKVWVGDVERIVMMHQDSKHLGGAKTYKARRKGRS